MTALTWTPGGADDYLGALLGQPLGSRPDAAPTRYLWLILARDPEGWNLIRLDGAGPKNAAGESPAVYLGTFRHRDEAAYAAEADADAPAEGVPA